MSKARKVLYLPQTQEAKTFQKGKAERHVQNMQQLSQSGHGARTPETCADVQLPGDSDGEASAPAECGYVIYFETQHTHVTQRTNTIIVSFLLQRLQDFIQYRFFFTNLDMYQSLAQNSSGQQGYL